MSLNAPVVYCIPEDTERVARAAFPHGNPYLLLTDELGFLYANTQFAALYSRTGQPGIDPARLALITVLQFLENLSDEEAATAVRARIDWKFALALPLDDPGFDSSVLAEFRARLVAGELEALLLDTLLTRIQERGLLKARGQARTDATQVLASVRVLTRLVCIGETLRAALNALATADPVWLAAQLPRTWLDRYSRRIQEYRLPKDPQARAQQAQVWGTDGQTLLTALDALPPATPLRALPAVQVLRQVWDQQFAAPDAHGVRHWRAEADLPPGRELIVSPYDAAARLSAVRGHMWTGYKVHWTEECSPETPHLITAVTTTAATTADIEALEPIHAQLQQQGLLPAVHYVDSGYVSGEQVRVSRQAYGVQVVGPARPDSSWQTRAGQGFGSAGFTVDWAAQQVTCPAGQTSHTWQPRQNAYGQAVIGVQFARATCAGCAVRAQCTKAQTAGRGLTLPPQEEYEARRAQQAEEQTAGWQVAYGLRAGIEGTLSQGVRLGDLRQTRYVGPAKTHLQHIVIAVAVNILRLVAWWQGRARAGTRTTAFGALATRQLQWKPVPAT